MIPFSLEPMPDELLYSYVQRLAIDILKTTILDRLLEIGYSGPAGREQFLPVISSWEHVDLFH